MRLSATIPCLSLALAAVTALGTTALANESPRYPVPNAKGFAQRYGAGWRVVTDAITGAPSFVYGKQFIPSFTPRSLNDFETAARITIDENRDLLGLDSSTLASAGVKYVSLAPFGTSDKIAARFTQQAGSLQVLGGSVCVLFDAVRGTVIGIDTTAVPFADQVPQHAVSSPQQATAAASQAYASELGFQAVSVGQIELMVIGPSAFFGRKNPLTSRGPTLAYKVSLSSGDARTQEGVPMAANVFVSAEGDLTVFKVDRTTHTAITGNVKGNVNTGPEPNSASNQEQPNLENVWVRQNNSSGAVLATTDANGNFTINQDGPINLFFELRGPFDNVNNTGGTDASFTVSASAGTPVNILFNPAKTELTTAEVAGHYWANRFRDYVKSVDPTDTTMDFNVVCNVNLNDSCNAFYDGSSINFYHAAGGCPNTAYQTVVHHEEGHWANEKYTPGGVTGAFHEGAADAWAYYIGDSPCLGPDFFGPGTGCLRSGEQTSIKKCPNDSESCHGGEVHTEGEVIGAGLWKVRARLEADLGTGPGGALASALFLSWWQVYNDNAIREVICDHWLALDDDNGDLSDGSPHFNDINEGFRDQGWNGFDLPDLVINLVSGPAQNQGVGNFQSQTIVANITSALGSVTSTSLGYSSNDGQSFTTLNMNPTGNPNEYSATIPGFQSPESIRWFLAATSSAGGDKKLPAAAPDDFFIYHAGVVNVVATYVFDGGTDEGWTHASLAGGSLGDQWERRSPPSNEPTDPLAAFSAPNNWGTDLSGAGTDGKYEPTTSGELRSPIFDFSARDNVRLQYRRWLAVEAGQFDQAVILVNNTSVWSNPQANDLVDSTWVLQDLDVSAVAAHNPSTQFKWRLTADGGVEFGGWNIDSMQVLEIDPIANGSFSPYGNGCAGTGGQVPSLSGTGNPTPGGSVTLNVANGLAFGHGLVLASLTQASLPLPGGCTLNVGLPFNSVIAVSLNFSGMASLSGTIPSGIPSDVHVYFQFFGFDTGSGNGEFSSSNGLDMHIL